MRSYDLYLFDMDDTLIRTYDTVSMSYYPQLARMLSVASPSAAAIRRHWGGDILDSLRTLFVIPGAEENSETILKRLVALHQETPVPMVDGVAQILSTLRKHEKGIALFSGSHPDILETCIEASLPGPLAFDLVFSLAEQKLTKPSPHIVYALIDQYNRKTHRTITLDQVLMVGDSINDYLTAKNACVDFAAVLSGPEPEGNFTKAGLNHEHIFRTVKDAIKPPASHGIVALIKDDAERFLFVQEARSESAYKGCWSGPHGRCEEFDILEEETVTREVLEEIGVNVKPVRKIYTRAADTKVDTISFWEAAMLSGNGAVRFDDREIRAASWFTLEQIESENLPLFPGTKDFFDKNYHSKGRRHGIPNT